MVGTLTCPGGGRAGRLRGRGGHRHGCRPRRSRAWRRMCHRGHCHLLRLVLSGWHAPAERAGSPAMGQGNRLLSGHGCSAGAWPVVAAARADRSNTRHQARIVAGQALAATTGLIIAGLWQARSRKARCVGATGSAVSSTSTDELHERLYAPHRRRRSSGSAGRRTWRRGCPGARPRPPGSSRRPCRGPRDSGGLARVVAQQRDPRMRRMFRSLAKPRIVLTRTHSPSKSHHTTEVCG